MGFRKQICVFVFVCTISTVQTSLTTEGERFLLYFTEGSLNTFPPRPLHLYLTTKSSSPISVNVTTPAWHDQDSVNQTLQVTSDSPAVASLPPSLRSTEIGRESKAILVESSGLISVFGLNPSQNQAGLFAVLPVSSLGHKYIFPSFTNFHIKSHGFIGIVIEHDQTEIKVTFPASTEQNIATVKGISYGPLSTFETILNKFEVAEIRQHISCPKTLCDLSGSIISANKPVAVFSTVSLSSPLTNGASGDMLVEQIAPVSSWGRSYITMTSPDDAYGNIVRVMAGEPKVTVYLSNMTTFTLDNPGQFEDIFLPAGKYLMLQGDGKLQVIQYSSSAPFMLIVTALEYFSHSAHVPTVDMDTTSIRPQRHTLVIVTRVCDAEFLYINGTRISQLSPWRDLGTSDFVMANIPVKDAGFHRIYSESGSDAIFGGYVYGQGDVTAYAAPLAAERNAMIDNYLWADPSAIAMHETNLVNKDRIKIQAWKLVERDVVSSRVPLATASVISPISCFDECKKREVCKYAAITKGRQGKKTCRLFDNRMPCSKRDPSPGGRTYTSKLRPGV